MIKAGRVNKQILKTNKGAINISAFCLMEAESQKEFLDAFVKKKTLIKRI
jgi:hypothetical protein